MKIISIERTDKLCFLVTVEPFIGKERDYVITAMGYNCYNRHLSGITCQSRTVKRLVSDIVLNMYINDIGYINMQNGATTNWDGI